MKKSKLLKPSAEPMPNSVMAISPDAFRCDLLNWYKANARDLPWRNTLDPYQIWVSEIMLQQTRVETVLPFYIRFINTLPAIEDLACADEKILLKLWEGLGYYSRVRHMQQTARLLVEKHHGRIPCDPSILRSLPGIGPYTAGAVASIAFGLPVPAADGNVYRVIARLTGDTGDLRDTPTKNRLSKEAARLLCRNESGAFNQALMELGALICLPNAPPRCDVCPVSSHCMAKIKDLTQTIPVLSKKNKPRKEDKTVMILSFGDRYALNQRPATGLLGGLWEFLLFDGKLSREECLQLLDPYRLNVRSICLWGNHRHIFSHIRWEMTGYRIHLDEESLSDPWVWVTLKELDEYYTVPAAFHSFLDRIRSE